MYVTVDHKLRRKNEKTFLNISQKHNNTYCKENIYSEYITI